jgi:hypothetical protein
VALLRTLVVLGLIAVVVVLTVRVLSSPHRPRSLTTAGGRWRTAHYEVDGATRVVVQRVVPEDATLLDEHLVATVPVDDPDYDARFLEAMARARQRVALFEAEEE